MMKVFDDLVQRYETGQPAAQTSERHVERADLTVRQHEVRLGQIAQSDRRVQHLAAFTEFHGVRKGSGAEFDAALIQPNSRTRTGSIPFEALYS